MYKCAQRVDGGQFLRKPHGSSNLKGERIHQEAEKCLQHKEAPGGRRDHRRQGGRPRAELGLPDGRRGRARPHQPLQMQCCSSKQCGGQYL